MKIASKKMGDYSKYDEYGEPMLWTTTTNDIKNKLGDPFPICWGKYITVLVKEGDYQWFDERWENYDNGVPRRYGLIKFCTLSTTHD